MDERNEQDEPVEYGQKRYSPPEGAADILLIRHGSSAPARPGKPFPFTDGHGDPDLAPEGVEQAERLGERLGGEHFDAIYVTTLRRTAQTAEPLARRLGLTPEVEPGLREVNLGEWEAGLFRTERSRRTTPSPSGCYRGALGRHPRRGEPRRSPPGSRAPQADRRRPPATDRRWSPTAG